MAIDLDTKSAAQLRNHLQPIQTLLDLMDTAPCNLPADLLLQAIDARTALMEILMEVKVGLGT